MDNIGRYQLLEKLGQGGMGIVYRGFDTLLQRVVAVKVISAPLEGNPELRDRFFREARAAGQLTHRHIITIHDLGEHNGQPYLAMEYLEGEDLQRRMTRPDRMSLQHKLQLAVELCDGLEFAHKHGVIHRDIKPANVFITENGTVKILDFGLARLVTSELTNSNMMMGTLNYMAPEQVRGERADQRSDVFSVGVLLYELLSGRKAFEGDSFASTLYKILQEVPEPLQKIDATLPPELIAIVEHALAKPRDERYQTMGELLRDLAVYRQHLAMLQSPIGTRAGFAPPASGGGPTGTWAKLSTTPETMPATPAAGSATALQSPPPMPSPVLAPPGSGASAPPAGTAPGGGRGIAIGVAAAAVLAIAAIGLWVSTRDTPPAAPAPAASAPASAPAAEDPAVAAGIKAASEALQRGDHAGAVRAADGVLARAPGHGEAQRVRQQAQRAADTIERGLRDARSLFDAGRFEEAARAAGDVLTAAPSHAEAKRLMSEAAARSRGASAEQARRRMTAARNAAAAAGAATLAGGSYRAALNAERDAQRLYDAGRLADATAKFYEASGLFRSAEIAAESAAAAAAANAERARATAAQPERRPAPATEPPATPPPAPKPEPVEPAPPPSLGSAVRPGVGASSIGAPSAAPSAPAPAAPPPAPPPPAPDPAKEIRDLLTRYEAALEARSLDAVRRLWPGLDGPQMDAIRREFQQARQIDVEIDDPRITANGSSATATFIRRYELLTTDGQRLRSQSRTSMTLRRLDGGWVIQQIRFEPIR